MDDAVGQGEAEEHEGNGRVVKVDRPSDAQLEKGPRHALDAILAAGDRAPLVRNVEEHLRERERDHREVDPASADRQVAEGNGERGRGEHARERRQRERQGELLRREGRGVSTQPPEGRVAEREQSHEAKKEVD